ncbi:MAG: tyrosine-type recombinase/integrase [Betaproteobacteria bacterium]|nr:tyrosine-type recombinase/integrase [Betaproteobacteria bacterium]
MPLHDIDIRNAKPKNKPYKLPDGNGLFLLIKPNGAMLWRLRYRHGGKEKMLSLGAYPEVSLEKARKRRDGERGLVADKQDPSAVRKLERENTFELVALKWWEQWKGARAPKYAGKVLKRMETDIFPAIGGVSVNKLTAPMVTAMVKAVSARGALDTAGRAYQVTSKVMRYAVANGLADRNPAADFLPSDVIEQRKTQNFARLDEKELPELLCKINEYDGATTTKYALQFMALTFVRTSELIGALWAEINLDAKQWRIPAERMKMKTPHIVPLSRQALAVLDDLRKETGHRELVFASDVNPQKSISNNTVLYALYRMGYHSRMTGHGFRGMASTILHEHDFPHEHIELQLAHQARSKTSQAYNYASYVPQRAKMMQWWADYLTRAATLRVVPLLKKGA